MDGVKGPCLSEFNTQKHYIPDLHYTQPKYDKVKFLLYLTKHHAMKKYPALN